MNTGESDVNSAHFCVFPQNIVPFMAAGVLKHSGSVELPDCFIGSDRVIN